jgi:small subunit ribosomal protein S16
MGSKKRPFYRIVAADSRMPRDGRFIETLGYYNPVTEPAEVRVDEEGVFKWLERGAVPTTSAASLLRRYGHLQKWELMKQGVTGDDLANRVEAIKTQRDKTAAKREAEKEPSKKALEKAKVAKDAEATEVEEAKAAPADADAAAEAPKEEAAAEAPKEEAAAEAPKEEAAAEAPKEEAAAEAPKEEAAAEAPAEDAGGAAEEEKSE